MNALSSGPSHDARRVPSHGPQKLTLIAAVTQDLGIGLNNRLLVALPEDLKHFKRTTLGCPVIMGRKTWDSLPPAFRPLPGRRNIVLSRSGSASFEGAEVASSLEEALNRLQGVERAFVIGGEQIYRQALPFAHELILTEIDAQPPADAFFPRWAPEEFVEVQRVEGAPSNTSPATAGTAAPTHTPRYAFVTYARP